jgi:hypothetical protein
MASWYLQLLLTRTVCGLLLVLAPTTSARADSSSPLLAAYYDRQMAIIDGRTYLWQGDREPRRLRLEAIQVGVGDDVSYMLNGAGVLQAFRDVDDRCRVVRRGR